MTTWRPAPRISFKALGLHWRSGRLLAAEVLDDAGRVKGVRPLGGSVEFGETAAAAITREFLEELGITVEVVGPPVFMENFYTHEGHLGHELLAIFNVTFPDAAFADETRIEFQENDGAKCFAEWFSLDALDLPDGPINATVKIRIRAHKNVFVDQLGFVKGEAGWQIVSKIWHLESVVDGVSDPNAA